MTKKIAMVIFTHECEEDPCHMKNETQENWIYNHVKTIDKLKWNWKLEQVRVVDLKGHNSKITWDNPDKDEIE
jgi:hypothetical protein|tara:strand:- start:160 stop:378 length:219 start_codon:yes stop_codon:yes gene_type:complete